MNKKSFSISNIGTVSLLMALIVLCLVIFSVLSLSASVNEHRYTQTLADNQYDYYRADQLARNKLEELDLQGWSLTSSSTYSFEIPINDHQSLLVELAASDDPDSENVPYRISKWQKITTSQWEMDDTPTILQ